MNSEPRVWHIGGSDVDLRIPLLRRVRGAGFEVAAVGTSDPAVFAAAEIPFFEYALKPGMGAVADLRARRQLEGLFHEHRPGIVHAFDTKPSLLVPHAARNLPDVRCVRTITGMGRVFSGAGVVWPAVRAVYRTAHRHVADHCAMTVFQNEDDREYFTSNRLLKGGAHAIVRGSGVDVEGVRAAAPDAERVQALRREIGAGEGVLVLMVTRLVVSKGVREFMRAAAAVRAESPATFVLVGPVDETERSAERLLREVEQSPHIVYLGRRDDVPALLAAADVFTLPTYYREGLPRVLLEAAVMGVPIVSTPVTGCPRGRAARNHGPGRRAARCTSPGAGDPTVDRRPGAEVHVGFGGRRACAGALLPRPDRRRLHRDLPPSVRLMRTRGVSREVSGPGARPETWRAAIRRLARKLVRRPRQVMTGRWLGISPLRAASRNGRSSVAGPVALQDRINMPSWMARPSQIGRMWKISWV